MRREFIFILIGIILVCSCNNKTKKQQVESQVSDQTIVQIPDSLKKAKVEIKESNFNFGEIQQGEVVSHTFYFKNTGDKDLILLNTESSCGCTIPKYDKKPIPPGGEGKIEVEFNSAGRMGKQYKVIHIFANIPEKSFTLKITANIKN